MESNSALLPVAAEKAKCLFDREEFLSEGFSRKHQCPAPQPTVRQNLTTSQPARPAMFQCAPAQDPQPRTTRAPSPPIPIEPSSREPLFAQITPLSAGAVPLSSLTAPSRGAPLF